MIRTVFISAASIVLAGSVAIASGKMPPVGVPSGQPVAFHESFFDDAIMGLTARYRFVASELATRVDSLSYSELEADLAHLCSEIAAPSLSGVAQAPAMIVISLSAEPTEFGAPTPHVVEVFEAYRFENGGCTWEAF